MAPDPILFNDPAFDYRELRTEIDAAVGAVLAGGDYIRGRAVAEFEREFGALLGARFAVGVASGTDALILCLRAAGIGVGDEVITAANSFTATAMAIVHAGARPVFADVDPETLNLDPAGLDRAFTNKTRAVIPVHLYGLPADMDGVLAWAEKKGVVAIEDACQAHGARCKGRAAGTLGTLGAFSFYPTKNLGGAGDGGLVATDSESLADRVRALAAYGSREKDRHEFVGTNSRLDSIQAAVLAAKLKRLEAWNRARARNAAVYREVLGSSPLVRLPASPSDRTHVYHQFVIRVPAPKRDPLRERLRDQGIPTMIHYPVPIHLQPAFSYLGYKPGSLTVTESAAGEIISLPAAQHLDQGQIGVIAHKILDSITNLSN